MVKDLKKLRDILGVSFKNEELLHQAFIHRSYINENPAKGLNHNERLEFLGDAVLELAVTDYLYKNYPNSEGDLTSWRAALVNTQIMALIADELGLNDFLYLSRGEAKDTGKARQAILANTLEAVIGALYLDQGYEPADKFITKYILSKLPKIIKEKLYRDSKSLFQESAQEKEGITPIYKVLSETGPDHDRHFNIGVFLGSDLIASGEGSSKQEGEQAAATAALHKKGWE